jgi:hypothetical protein
LRIELSPQQLAKELARPGQGALVKLPRDDFEKRVRSARQAAAAQTAVARIVRAHYMGELSERDLTLGRGEWVVSNPGPGAALLPLSPLALALDRCAWESGRDAVLGDLDSKGLAAWVKEPGIESLFFDWTCRGTPTPQGLAFDLRLPASPQTTLELKLPADMWPSLSPKAGLVTGPHDAGAAGKKLWRLQLAGKTQVSLVVRRVQAAPSVPLFYQTQVRQVVTPDRVLAEYEFQVEVPQGAIRELAFEADGSLEPFEANLGSVELPWRWEPPPESAEGKPGRGTGTLVVAFREPQQGPIAPLRIRCLAPRPAAANWASPALRLRQAICRSETLKLQLQPDVHLGRLERGDFQLVNGSTDADGTLTLTFSDPRATLGIPSARPRFQVAGGGAEFTTAQRTRWHIEPDGTFLECDVSFHVSRGQLHQLAVKLPAAGGPYHVESVETEPKESLRDWAPAGGILFVELQKGLTPQSIVPFVLRLRLRSTLAVGASPVTIDLADVEPVGAALRKCMLQVTTGPLLHAQLLQSSVPPLAALPLSASPAAQERPKWPAFAFAYRDQALSGKLRVFPRRPQLQVHSRQEVAFDAQARWQARVEIEPLVGRPAWLDVYLSSGLRGAWQVTAEGHPALVHQWERLPLQEILPHLLPLGSAPAAGQAAAQFAIPRGQLWRVHFAQPLTEKTTLVFQGLPRVPAPWIAREELSLLWPGASPWNALASMALMSRRGADGSSVWDIPILSVVGAPEQHGELAIWSAERAIVRAQTHGLQTAISASMWPRHEGGSSVLFRFEGRGYPWARLELKTTPARDPTGALCEKAELTTCQSADGMLHHLLRVKLRNWHRPRFSITVPGAARGLAARIDGIWADRLDEDRTPDGTRLSAPVNVGTGLQQIELYYSSRPQMGACPLVQTIASPDPRLPPELNPPLEQKRYWRLPATWIPWDISRTRQRGQPEVMAAQATLSSLPAKVWHAGEAILPPWDAAAAWSQSQRSDLYEAEAKLRPQLAKGVTLGEALERLATSLRDQIPHVPLVVDAEALRALGRSPMTPLPAAAPLADRPFWESLGLIYVPCKSGALLSTADRLCDWREEAGTSASVGEMLAAAIAEAALFGSDHAGSLESVDRWLRITPPGPPRGASADAARAFSLLTGPLQPGWKEWEPMPGLPRQESLTVLDVRRTVLLGYCLAALWLLPAGWVARRLSLPTLFRAHVLAALLLCLTMLWLPASPRDLLVWPIVLSELLILALTFTIRAWPGREPLVAGKSTMRRQVRPAAVAAIAVMALPAVPLLAQVPPSTEPYRVFIVTGDEDKQSALVSPDLLAKLEEMSNRPAATPANAVIVSAHYQGKVKENSAEIETRFELYHFGDQSTFVLPLSGIRLLPGVFLDGAPVFPVAHKGGLALPVRGKGFHRLTLRFEVRAASVNEYQELRFGIPKAAQCQLELSWSGPMAGSPAKTLHLPAGLGEEKSQLDKQGNGTLHAQLGHEGLVQVRWPAAQRPLSARTIEVHEAYLWDLRPASLGLTGAVQFSVTNGTMLQARFALPEGIDIRSVELAGRTGPPTLLPGASIRRWDVIGNDPFRQLVVEFTQPVSGSVPLLLEMVPRVSLTPGQWQLRLPSPLIGTETEGFLAYRLEGMEAKAAPQNLSVATVAPELFAKTWARIVRREAPIITEAASFRRTAPAAGLALAVQPTRPVAQMELLWRVGWQHADLAAQIKVTDAAEGLVLVELELPPGLKLTQIGGKQVHHWNGQDRLVQVWLQQARKQVSLDVRGWIENKVTPAPGRFELAPMRVANVRAASASIALEPETGLSLTPGKLRNLNAPAKEGGTLRFTSSDSNYNGVFTLQPNPVPATGRAFTLVERRRDVVEMTTALHLQPRPGEVQVRVSGWTGTDLRLDIPSPIVRKAYRQEGTQHVWTLQLPPGLPQIVTLSLHGRLAVTNEPWKLPIIETAPIRLQDHWVGLEGVEPAGKDGTAFRAVGASAKAAADWPVPPHTLVEKARVGKLTDPGTSLALRVPPSATAAFGPIVLAEQELVWGGDVGWIHQLKLFVFSNGDAEVRAQPPVGADFCAVAVGAELMVPGKGELVIPLPGAPGPRLVQLCWTYRQGLETASAPRLASPTIAGLDTAALQRRLWLPAAYELPGDPVRLAERAMEGLLQRAEAHMRLCALSASAGTAADALVEVQRALYADLDRAKFALAFLDGASETASATELSRRVVQLDEKNGQLAREHGYESARQAARKPWAAPGPAAVLPLTTESLPLFTNARGALPDTFPLISFTQRQDQFAQTATELVLLAGVTLLLLSYMRRVFSVFRALWPELLLALTLLGMWLGGVSPVGAILLAVTAGLSMVWLVLIVRGALQRWFAPGLEQTDGEIAQPDTSPTP